MTPDNTLLRQSVHFSCSRSNYSKGLPLPALQKVLAQYLDKVAGKPPGTRKADDAWVAEMTHTIYASSRGQAAEAAAAALAEGISPEVVGEAIALAANEIILRQTKNRTHGDSRAVHASDAVNAWGPEKSVGHCDAWCGDRESSLRPICNGRTIRLHPIQIPSMQFSMSSPTVFMPTGIGTFRT